MYVVCSVLMTLNGFNERDCDGDIVSVLLGDLFGITYCIDLQIVYSFCFFVQETLF